MAERPIDVVDRKPVDADALLLADDGIRALVQAYGCDMVAAADQRLRQQRDGNFGATHDFRRIEGIDEQYLQRSPRISKVSCIRA